MAVTTNSITTIARRTELAQATAGLIETVSKVTHMAFGDGGVDAQGEPVAPSIDQTGLTHEICRYPVELLDCDISTTSRYQVVIPKAEQAGAKLNEVALVSATGTCCAIKTMYTKQKDEDVEFTFTFDDEF